MKKLIIYTTILLIVLIDKAMAGMPDCYNAICLKYEKFDDYYSSDFSKGKRKNCSTVERYIGKPSGKENMEIVLVFYAIYNPEIWNLVYIKRKISYGDGNNLPRIISEQVVKKYGEPIRRKNQSDGELLVYEENDDGPVKKAEIKSVTGNVQLIETVVGFDYSVLDIENTVRGCTPQHDEDLLPD